MTHFLSHGNKKCDKVWLRLDKVRKPLETPYTGPFKVIERNPKYFVIEVSDNVHNTVSIDRLKPFIESLCNKFKFNHNSDDVREITVNHNSHGNKKCYKVWLRLDKVRKPLETPYTGPFKVIERNPKYFVIEVSDNVHNTVSIDRLKPFIESLCNKFKFNHNSDDVREITVNLDADVEQKVDNLDLPEPVNKGYHFRYGRKKKFMQSPEYRYF